MAAVRQHYKLATTGKPGQKANVKSGSSVMSDRGPSGAADAHKGSGKVHKHQRGK